MKISVVLLAKNEEKYIDQCLKNFSDPDKFEIIFGDMKSTDRTLEIAKRYTHNIYSIDQTDYLDYSKSLLAENASCEYILVVDADEIFPDELLDKLLEIASRGRYSAVDIPRQIYILGEKVVGMQWQTDHVVRFFKKGSLTYSKYHHTQPEIKGNLLKLPRDRNLMIQHFWVDSWTSLVRKISYYSQGQAEKLDKSGVKYTNTRMLIKVLKEFLSRYFKNYGFLNGWIGFKVSLIMTFDVLFTYLKLEEIQKNKV